MSSRTLLVAVQTLLLTPLWTLLLWLTNATLSLLEWAFAIDLLDPATMGSVARTLTAMRATLTEPWLVALLALAAIALLYHAIVRRRMADSVGEAAAMTAMILAGLWIITNPAGTVGEINRALNQTGLGAVAAVSAADPSSGRAAFGDGLRAIFATAIQGPWCYLEFGDVDWCRNPRRLDPRLTDTARALRTQAARRRPLRPDAPACPEAAEPRREAQLLADAHSNGELFLAFPTNSGHRNAINADDSLYHALCGNDDDNDCRGATAQAAQWRTESGTWPRAGGLMLIAVGSVGMLALLLFIALRLLGAAILTVVYLLLAPLAVLAPTIGESGRAAFRGWATRLLGALVAKLIYALFLGVVLLTLSILDGLGSLGWWTQWLLIAAFWWIVFVQRHEVLAYARLGHAETGARGLRLAGGLLAARQLTRAVSDTTSPGRRLIGRTGRTTGQAFTATRSRLAEERAKDAERRRAHGARPRPRRRPRPGRATLGRRAAQRRDARVTRRERRSRPRRAGRAPPPHRPRDRRRPLDAAIADAPCDCSTATRAWAGRPTNGARRSSRAQDTIARAADARHAAGRAFRKRDLENAGCCSIARRASAAAWCPGRAPTPMPIATTNGSRRWPASPPTPIWALPPGEQRRARLTIDRELDARRARMEARPTRARDAEGSWWAEGRASAPPRAPRHRSSAVVASSASCAISAADEAAAATRLVAFAVAAGCRGDRGEPHRRGRGTRPSRPSIATRRRCPSTWHE